MTCPPIGLSDNFQCDSHQVMLDNSITDIISSNICINVMGILGITNILFYNYLAPSTRRTYTLERYFPLFKFSYMLGLINSIYMSTGGYQSGNAEQKFADRVFDLSTRISGLWQNLLFLFTLVFKAAPHNRNLTNDFLVTSYLLGVGNSIYSSIYAAFHNIKNHLI